MTKANDDPEYAEAEERVWEDLRTKLSSLHTYLDALQLAADGAPALDAPGRRCYANLAFFLRTAFEVPVRSSYAEKQAYLELVRRLDAAGQLKPGVGKQAEDALRRAMAAQKN
jgi:hypothetical protein